MTKTDAFLMVVRYENKNYFRFAPKNSDLPIMDVELTDKDCVNLATELLKHVGLNTFTPNIKEKEDDH